MTRSQTSKVKEKCEKSSESDNGDDIDDTSEDTGEYSSDTSCLCVTTFYMQTKLLKAECTPYFNDFKKVFNSRV